MIPDGLKKIIVRPLSKGAYTDDFPLNQYKRIVNNNSWHINGKRFRIINWGDLINSYFEEKSFDEWIS